MLAMDSPVGPLLIRASACGVTDIMFMEPERCLMQQEVASIQAAAMRNVHACARQIEEYFRGKRQKFDVPLDLPAHRSATAFRRRIWQAMQTVPFGGTVSYRDLAALGGHPGASRAAGGACRANPLPILIPCHRVLGSGGGLTGYAGGLARKKKLLEHEAL